MNTELIGIYGTIIAVLWAVVIYFLKRTMTTVDAHEKDINHIKQTYVEKSELEKVRTEIRGDMAGVQADIVGMKDTFLTKEDFYRSQAAVDKKLDKIYDLILAMKGGGADGQK